MPDSTSRIQDRVAYELRRADGEVVASSEESEQVDGVSLSPSLDADRQQVDQP